MSASECPSSFNDKAVFYKVIQKKKKIVIQKVNATVQGTQTVFPKPA